MWLSEIAGWIRILPHCSHGIVIRSSCRSIHCNFVPNFESLKFTCSVACMTNSIVRNTYDSFVRIFVRNSKISFVYLMTRPRQSRPNDTRTPPAANHEKLSSSVESSMNWINIVYILSFWVAFFVVSLPNFSVCCSFFLKQLSVLLPKNLLLKMNNCLFYHARHIATLWHSFAFCQRLVDVLIINRSTDGWMVEVTHSADAVVVVLLNSTSISMINRLKRMIYSVWHWRVWHSQQKRN